VAIEPVYGDKLRERVIFLKRFFPHLEWGWPNEAKSRVSEQVFGGKLLLNQPINIEELAKTVTDGQLEPMIQLSPLKDYYSFRGKYYTVRRGGIFDCVGSWEEVKAGVRQILKVHGKKGYALLKALAEVTEAHFEAIAIRASEICGERLYPSHLIAELRDKWDLAWEAGSRRYPKVGHA